MTLKKSSKGSRSTRNGTARVKLKKLLRRRSVLSKAAIQRMVRKEMKKQVHKILHAVNSLAGLESTSGIKLHSTYVLGPYAHSPGSLPNQVEPSELRRLRLHFVSKLPTKLFTANTLYAIADETDLTKSTLPVSVELLDENNDVVTEGPLSSLKVQILVACGSSKGDESETRLVSAREENGSLLVGSCMKTMENGVCSFSDLKFVDNSSWVPSKMFRLVAKVAESARVPSTVEIREAVTGPFRVKDQRGKSHEKHSIPSLDDEVRRLEKIGMKYNGKLEAAGIHSVKDFLRKYYTDHLSLKMVLGVKKGVWETIVQHATKCVPNGEYFRYESEEEGVELLFNCFYKLVGVSFDHQNHQSFETLNEYVKGRVEQVRLRAFEHENNLVQINYPVGWPSANLVAHHDQAAQDKEVLLFNCPSYPQSPLLQDHDQIMQQEEEATQSIAGMKDIYSILTSDTLIRDTFVIDSENHPFSIPDFSITASYMFHGHGQGSNCRPVVSKAGRVWYRARVAVLWFLVASLSNKTRMVIAAS